MHKKIATTVLSASLLAASLSGAAAAESATNFRDLQNVTGHDKILALHDKKIVSGVSKTAFAPQSKLTQAEALQLIVNGFKLDEKPLTDALIALKTLFPAVNEQAWYANAFTYAHYNGVDIPKSVSPSEAITREQYIDYVMTGLQAVGNMPAIDVVAQDIADGDKLDPAYLDSVQLAIVFGIADLDSEHNFNPTQEITRAEAAVILYNAVEFLEKSSSDQVNSNDERIIDVLPHEQPTTAPATGLYAAPENGKFFSTGSVQQAIDEQAAPSTKIQVAVTLFENGTPIDEQSAKGAAELKRLQSLGYDIDYAQAWTYQGNLEKVEYTYISGVFTAEQLESFRASANYGYAFDFAANGDGSAVLGKDGAVTGTKSPRLIAE